MREPAIEWAERFPPTSRWNMDDMMLSELIGNAINSKEIWRSIAAAYNYGFSRGRQYTKSAKKKKAQ